MFGQLTSIYITGYHIPSVTAVFGAGGIAPGQPFVTITLFSGYKNYNFVMCFHTLYFDAQKEKRPSLRWS